jgi:hypothetical protein
MRRIADHYSRDVEPRTEREPEMKNLTIRRATAADEFAVRRLSALDSAFPPTGDVLLAEMGGELWAALSIDSGHAVADPFRRSGDLVELLRFRAERLGAEEPARGRVLARVLPRAA